MKWLQRLWRTVSDWLLFLKPLRVVVFPLLALLFALIFADQGQDSVRAVVEFTRECPRWGVVAGFIAAVVLLAIQAWYWSRQLLRVDFAHRKQLEETHEVLELWAPRVLGAMAFVIAIAALLRAGAEYVRGDVTRTNIGIVVAILVVLMIAFVIAVIFRRRVRYAGEAPKKVDREHRFDRGTVLILRGTALGALIFLILTCIVPERIGAI